jgi:hypothetical protein
MSTPAAGGGSAQPADPGGAAAAGGGISRVTIAQPSSGPPSSYLPVATYAQPPTAKPQPPQIWGSEPSGPPLPAQSYSAAYPGFPHPYPHQGPMFIAPGGGLHHQAHPMIYAQGSGFGGAPIVIMGPAPIPLVPGIPEDFARYGCNASLLIAFFSCVCVAFAASPLATPWVLVPMPAPNPPPPIATCALAFGVTQWGLFGSSCPPYEYPAWPATYISSPPPPGYPIPSAGTGQWVTAFFSLAVAFFTLAIIVGALLAQRFRASPQGVDDERWCAPFATVRNLVSFTSTGFAAAWIAGVFGINFFNNLRAAFVPSFAAGSGAFLSQALFATSIISITMSAVLKCKVRALALTRTPET